VIESIAKKRGCILKGKHAARFANELDMDKASLILLLEYRTGTLGRISLETPQSRAAMLAAAETPPAADTEEEGDE
jgi:ribosome biogenesis GTPase A